MSSNLDSTTSIQPPPESLNPLTAIATRIPPELLLDIFTSVSDSPSKTDEQYLERNRNLKSLAIVHSAWKDSAQQVLQEEVLITCAERKMASDEEVERITSLLIDSKVEGTKYLTVGGHLNELIAKTGYAMWSQVRHLEVLTGSRNDGTTRMSDFAAFPRKSLFSLRNITRSNDRRYSIYRSSGDTSQRTQQRQELLVFRPVRDQPSIPVPSPHHIRLGHHHWSRVAIWRYP